MSNHWLLDKVGCPEELVRKISVYTSRTGNTVQSVVREGLALWALKHRDDELAQPTHGEDQ